MRHGAAYASPSQAWGPVVPTRPLVGVIPDIVDAPGAVVGHRATVAKRSFAAAANYVVTPFTLEDGGGAAGTVLGHSADVGFGGLVVLLVLVLQDVVLGAGDVCVPEPRMRVALLRAALHTGDDGGVVATGVQLARAALRVDAVAVLLRRPQVPQRHPLLEQLRLLLPAQQLHIGRAELAAAVRTRREHPLLGRERRFQQPPCAQQAARARVLAIRRQRLLREEGSAHKPQTDNACVVCVDWRGWLLGLAGASSGCGGDGGCGGTGGGGGGGTSPHFDQYIEY